MNQADYLQLPEVSAFVRWMAQHLTADSTVGHGYVRPNLPKLVFRILADAFGLYDWGFSYARLDGGRSSGRTFSDNATVLEDLQRRLRAAASVGDDTATRDAAIEVVRRGGVAPHNESWLRSNSPGLPRLLGKVTQAFEAGDDAIDFGVSLRFNAGMTKVYSLLVDNFIIYDSRVAVALAWFIVAWARAEQRPHIPESLRFPCMVAKEALDADRHKLRNPRTEQFYFPLLGNRPYTHAKWNLRANWIVGALLEAAPRTVFCSGSGGSRKLEAALFIWGYDLAAAD